VAAWYGSCTYFKIPKSPFIIHYCDDFGTPKKEPQYVVQMSLFVRPFTVNDGKTRFVT